MWIILSFIAVITGLLNIIFTFQKKNGEWFVFISMSFTSLTVCAFYSVNASWVTSEDWSALVDVTPTLSNVLWFCVIISILINGIALFKQKRR